jgi:hypothetical protein
VILVKPEIRWEVSAVEITVGACKCRKTGNLGNQGKSEKQWDFK